MIEFLMEKLQVSEDVAAELMVEYEVKMSETQDNEYGNFYKVDIYFSEEGVKNGLVEQLEEEDIESLIKISESHIVMFLEAEEGVHEIENAIGLFLDGDLGTFEWKCLI